MQGIQHETNVENARMLIEVQTNPPQTDSRRLTEKFTTQKINEKCFEKCIPKPGSSLSSSESVR